MKSNIIQINATNNKPYGGRNQIELQDIYTKRGYKSNKWLTFVQARELGLTLKNAKGQGVFIFNGYREITTTNKDNKTELTKRPMGWSCVFNLDLTEERKEENKEELKSLPVSI